MRQAPLDEANTTEKQLRVDDPGKEYLFVVWDDDQGVYRLKKCTHKQLWQGTSGNKDESIDTTGLPV